MNMYILIICILNFPHAMRYVTRTQRNKPIIFFVLEIYARYVICMMEH